MSPLVLFGFVTLAVGCAGLRTHIEAARLSRLDWDELVAKLEPIPGGISTIALDYLQPSKGQLRLETDQLWALAGGDEGVRRMSANAKILIALAGYAQRWNRVESVIVAERMRRDGIALRRAARKLSVSRKIGFGKVFSPLNVQEAASAYYLMRLRLLALYENSHLGRYPELAAAL